MESARNDIASAALRTALSISLLMSSAVQGIADETFHIPRDHVQFLTGDSWVDGSRTIRLYGVQACLRGKTYTDRNGRKQDCGVIAAAVLAAIVHDTDPICRSIAAVLGQHATSQSTVIAICTVHLGGRELDLGSMLITQGFAFAALANDGKPVYMPYRIQEMIARQARAGLWAYDDVPLPSKDLLAK